MEPQLNLYSKLNKPALNVWVQVHKAQKISKHATVAEEKAFKLLMEGIDMANLKNSRVYALIVKDSGKRLINIVPYAMEKKYYKN
jgi:hypothetical protein